MSVDQSVQAVVTKAGNVIRVNLTAARIAINDIPIRELLPLHYLHIYFWSAVEDACIKAPLGVAQVDEKQRNVSGEAKVSAVTVWFTLNRSVHVC